MITLEGKAKKPGVAIAVAAVVDAVSGINSISPALLQRGISSLRRNLLPQDYPEAIIACDNLAMGATVRIPGIRTIGLAVQSDQDIPGLPVDVPCAIGVPNLLSSINEGDIVIVDGHRGIVHIDPDPRMLIHYQEIDEQREKRQRIFLAAEHIPAMTQAGETVHVYAHCFRESDVLRAVDEGADGLLVDLRGSGPDCDDYYSAVLRDIAGKRVVFAVEHANDELLRAAMHFAVAHQVTILFPAAEYELRMTGVGALVEAIQAEAHASDLDPPEVDFGVIAHEHEYAIRDDIDSATALVIDLRESAYPEGDAADGQPQWISARKPDNTVALIGDRVDALQAVVESGARSVAVVPDAVGITKQAIRMLGVEDEA